MIMDLAIGLTVVHFLLVVVFVYMLSRDHILYLKHPIMFVCSLPRAGTSWQFYWHIFLNFLVVLAFRRPHPQAMVVHS